MDVCCPWCVYLLKGHVHTWTGHGCLLSLVCILTERTCSHVDNTWIFLSLVCILTERTCSHVDRTWMFAVALMCRLECSRDAPVRVVRVSASYTYSYVCPAW